LAVQRSRPFVRWWWFGGCLDRDEIEFELAEMKRRGIGGVEIQPVYPMAISRPPLPPNLKWLSPEFLEMLSFAIETGRRLGLTVDITLGSGWPFGGPHIPKRLAARKIYSLSWDLEAGQVWRLSDHKLEQDEQIELLVALQLVDGKPALDRAVQLTDTASPEFEWTAPEGRWRIVMYISGFTRQRVKRATVGAEGWVADHFSREAMETHFRCVGEKLAEAADGRVRCYFSDSWEVFSANWTDGFLDIFRERRGYDLRPYLPAIEYFVEGVTPAVRYDFYRTLSELVLESYIVPMREWCRSKGAYSRVQAHAGTPADIIKCYGESDIPECETGTNADSPILYRTPKFAASAARLYGRKEVSCEIFTHLRRPRFLVNPRMMKVAAERAYCHGVNHLIYHGYSYSPRLLGTPGWVFYASTMVNHNNTWWRHIKELNKWLSTIASKLHKGRSTADFIVYTSLADAWCRKTLEYRPSTLGLLSGQLGSLPETIWQAGYDFDLCNDELLSKMRLQDGEIQLSGLCYSALIVPPVRYISHESLAHLVRLIRSGATVIFIGQLPSESPVSPPGSSREQADRLLRELSHLVKDGYGRAHLVPSVEEMEDALRLVKGPDVTFSRQDIEFCFVHRRARDEDIYLLSYCGSHWCTVDVSFRNTATPFQIDPREASLKECPVYYRQGSRTIVTLNFPPFGSHLISFRKTPSGEHLSWTDIPWVERSPDRSLWAKVFSPGRYRAKFADSSAGEISVNYVPPPIPIEEWSLSVPGLHSPINMRRLISWTDIPKLRGYSGDGTYTSSFYVREEHLAPQTGLELNLGEIREVAEVFVNGKKAGCLWTPPNVLDISGLVRLGRNTIRVVVSNLLINKVLSSPKPDYSELVKVYGKRFPYPKEGECKPQPSGLLGPTEIKPYVKIGLKAGQVSFEREEI